MRAPHGRARARQPRDAEPGGRQPPAHKGRHGALEAARPRRRADAGQAQPPLRSSGVASTTAAYPPRASAACAAPGRFRLQADRSRGCLPAVALWRRGRRLAARPRRTSRARAAVRLAPGRTYSRMIMTPRQSTARYQLVGAGAGQRTQCEPAWRRTPRPACGCRGSAAAGRLLAGYMRHPCYLDRTCTKPSLSDC